MQNIRKAAEEDLCRVGEIFVFNNRINYFPIFGDEEYSFGYLQVDRVREDFFRKPHEKGELYVYDDGIIRGFLHVSGSEICKLYVDPCFQGRGFGEKLLGFAVQTLGADFLWALEKNTKALRFYARSGFLPTGEKVFEEDTTEYLLRLERKH